MLTHQRILEAQRLLETTDLTVAGVADRCGLGTPTNLRRHLRAHLGVAPSSYRAAFAHPPAALTP